MTARSRIIPAIQRNGITLGRGRSSGVERNLAKVEVEGSNPFARSKTKVIPQKKDISFNTVLKITGFDL